MRHFILLLAIIFLSSINSYGQATTYSVKSAFTLGLQTWDRIQSDPLLFHPGLAFEIESLSAEENSALYAQIGYLTRGSRTSIRRYIDGNGNVVNTSGNIKFGNASLQLGARAIKPWTESKTLYYGIGGRLEYNVTNNLDQYDQVGNSIYTTLPVPEFINAITYGITLAGGVRYYISNRLDGILELQLNTDMNNQYSQPPLGNVTDPNTGNSVSLPARTVRNTSIEIMLGIRIIK